MFGDRPHQRVEAWDDMGHPMIVGALGLVRADSVGAPTGIDTRPLRPAATDGDPADTIDLPLPPPCLVTMVLTESDLRVLGNGWGDSGKFAGQHIELICRMQQGHTGCHSAIADGRDCDPADTHDLWKLWGPPTPRERVMAFGYEDGPFSDIIHGSNCSRGRPLADGTKLACTLLSGHDGGHSYELAGYTPRRQDIWHPPEPRSPTIKRRRSATKMS
ncbi:hypothetical protein QLQ12_46025 [Actinoplanes sp. NEAU-A12]|uniref:Uncharacterized protein n=1 Tax=Actinoplanes sandaracinus TaxID=3045177 RepID=A0ABT6X1R9_9ACTN|nr:hypothetical protein [Actinoplanes sandaracinus]MDI6105953.1 hypothetical protein [Actinoplanes sandaracinus]